MTKIELISAVIEKTGLTKKGSAAAVSAVFDVITEFEFPQTGKAKLKER